MTNFKLLMDRHGKNTWPLAILCMVFSLVGVAQQDCESPECLLFEEMNNEFPGLVGTGDLMGDFPDNGSCLTAVENGTIYSFESLAVGDVEVILSPQADISIPGERLEAGLFTASDACDASTFIALDCGTSETQLSLTTTAMSIGTKFYIVVSGSTILSTPADFGYTVQIVGSAVELDPPFSVNPIYTINIGQEIQLMASEGASEYAWTVIDGDFNSIRGGADTLNPTVNPIDTTTYELMTTLGGCELTYDVTVNVIVTIFARNVITPNGDGINDNWFIGNAFLYPTMDVRVFSRWGQQVFRSTGYDPEENGWDGTNKGSALPAGTYYFVIDLNGDGNEETIVTGSVSIIF